MRNKKARPGGREVPLISALVECPRQDSNLRTRLRRAVLYPLSYGGAARNITVPPVFR